MKIKKLGLPFGAAGLTLAITLFWVGSGMAKQPASSINFHELYQSNLGEGQLADGKYAEAIATYTTLAADTKDPVLAALGKARAAVALGLQDGQYEAGLAQARTVTDRAYAVQACMQLMFAKEDFQRLVDEYRDEKIADWPERTLPSLPKVGREDVRALALFDRGRALLRIGETQTAARDIDQASEFAGRNRKLTILSFLAKDVYTQALKDTDKTFETNRRIVELDAGFAATFHAGLSAAQHLRERKRYDEALDVLAHFPWRTMSGYWFAAFANSVAKTLSDAGRFAEAADVYRSLAEAGEKKADSNQCSAAAVQWGRMLAATGNLEVAKTVFEALLARDNTSKTVRQQAEAALAELAQPNQKD